jgi:hypothetical protein
MKLSQLKQIIKEEIQNVLSENKTPEEKLFDDLLNDYQRKGVKALVGDKRYTELKEKNKNLATDLIGKVRRRAEYES